VLNRPALSALKWLLGQNEEIDLNLCTTLILGVEQEINFKGFTADNSFYLVDDYSTFSLLKTKKLNVNCSPIDKASAALIFGNKSKDENFHLLTQALAALKAEGKIVFILEGQLGGKSIIKHLKKFFKASNVMAKSHCQILLASKEDANTAEINTLPTYPAINSAGFYSFPRIFSWQEVDRGSKLLLSTMPSSICGVGVDLGCGFGYLGTSLLIANSEISEVHFWDIDLSAINATRLNLLNKDLKHKGKLYWRNILEHGLTNDKEYSQRYDWIVCNLPFHTKHLADRNLPKKFVSVISQLIKVGGTGYLLWHSQPPDLKDLCWQGFSSKEVIKVLPPYWAIKVAK
jgi:16S rRNA (guanine1207-N2)-methyltransferase